MREALATALACTWIWMAGCSPAAEPRPQLVIVIDTDLAPSGLAVTRSDLPIDATVDTVRVEVLDEAAQTYDAREFIVPELIDWPISLGVSRAGGGKVHLRIRAFRASVARGLASATDFEPDRTVTIDRLVTVDVPTDSVRTVRVTLRGDCFGVASRFVAPWKTCVDEQHAQGDPRDGLNAGDEAGLPTTQAGTWLGLEPVPCTGSAAADAVCIPGGYSLLGHASLVGWADHRTAEDSTPRHAVLLSPYWMDRTEFTVGRYRQLYNQGKLTLPEPMPHSDGVSAYCTWLGSGDDSNDALPLNCIRWESAGEACVAVSGTLPTEAQWEHAARGRQRASAYPWGDERPTCCVAAFSRVGPVRMCPEGGIDVPASHLPNPACGNVGDLSRDGVQDLGGNVAEFTLDSFLPFDHPCWMAQGVHRNPLCEDTETTSLRLVRGGDFANGPAWMMSAVRRGDLYTGSSQTGFRCVYPVQAP